MCSQITTGFDGTGSPPIEQIDGNTGSVTPVLGIINIIGVGSASTSGSGDTLTISIASATESIEGVVELATDAEAIAGIDSTNAIVASSLAAKLGDQTENGIAYGAGTGSALGWTAAGTDGQLVIAATGGAPAFATVLSSDGSITRTLGANSIDLEVDAAFSNSFVTDSGTATPSSGALTISGGANVNTSASGSTVTINLDDSVSVGSLDVDNINVNGNTISSTDTNGDITLTPDGTGTVNVSYLTQFTLPIAGASGAINDLADGLGASGEVLTSNGAGSEPTWQAAGGGSGFSSVVTQVFTADGTYTPTSGMDYCIVEVVGAGGGGGGAPDDGSEMNAGGSGGGGGYARETISAATIGSSQSITVGSGGTAGSGSSATAGGTGGTSSLGSLLQATGGVGGDSGSTTPPSFAAVKSGAGGVGSGGDLNVQGSPATTSVFVGTDFFFSGVGGSSYFGGGAPTRFGTSSSAQDGLNGNNYGGGASGGTTQNTPNGADGGTGADGVVVITEFIS